MRYILLLIAGLLSQDCIASSYNEVFRQAAEENHISEHLLRAVCWVESNHRTHLPTKLDGNSPSYGMCQVKMRTARDMEFFGSAKELRNPVNNIFVAARYLSFLLNRYKNNWRRAVTAYNRGHFNPKTMSERNRYVILVTLAMLDGR